MPFVDEFNVRFSAIISPAISSVSVNGKKLEPYRVDKGTAGESIVFEIIHEIASSQLILADISTIGKQNNKPIRNSNVMYEVGIAHAVRPPMDVILVRTDSDALPFDVQGIRVHQYDSAKAEESIKQITSLINDSLKIRELENYMAVKRALAGLDYESMIQLLTASDNPIPQPIFRTMGDIMKHSRMMDAVHRLLDRGLISLNFTTDKDSELAQKNEPGEKLFEYKITKLGKAVISKHAQNLATSAPHLIKNFLPPSP